jgi:hypothetical protein
LECISIVDVSESHLTLDRYQTNEELIQVTFDRTRNLLYTLSANSSIQVFYLGEDGDGFRMITSLDHLDDVAKRKLSALGKEKKEVCD